MTLQITLTPNIYCYIWLVNCALGLHNHCIAWGEFLAKLGIFCVQYFDMWWWDIGILV